MAIHDLTDITVIIEIEEIYITITIIIDIIADASKEHLIITDRGYRVIIEIVATMRLVSSRERVDRRSMQIDQDLSLK